MRLGDEGRAQNENYMIFHFMPNLSPAVTHAGASRFIMTTIPSEMCLGGCGVDVVYMRYVFDDHGRNLTLQGAARAITESLNSLAVHGAELPRGGVRLYFYVMNIKGDWKYLKELFEFQRHAGTHQARWTYIYYE